jgi:hypothetical protein
MKNLNPFSGDAKKEYKSAVARKPKDSESRKRLELIVSNIEAAYDIYKGNFDSKSLHSVTSQDLSSEIRKDLVDMYDYQSRIIRNIRADITNQQVITIQSTCQNCTIDSVNTMDHVLPQKKFPEFAVNGYNLFPCCSRCNGYKSEITEYSAFLNLFLDELPSVQYLFVNVYWNIDSVNFDFFLSNSAGIISVELYTKIENHYTNLHLLQRMKEASRTYLSEFISTYKHFYKKSGRDSIIEAVRESIEEDRVAYGYNYWKCSLKSALIASNIFWGYMDDICM